MPSEICKTKHPDRRDKVRAHLKPLESAPSANIHSIPPTPCALDDFLSRPEFCRRYGISLRTAEMMAHKSMGPKVTHLGKRAYYHIEDIAIWCEVQREKSAARFASQRDG